MELKPKSYRLSIVLDSFFFPLTAPDILDSLKTRGFKVAQPPTPMPSGQRFYIGGFIAQKFGCWVNLEDNRNIFGCHGTSAEDVVQIFGELLEILEEDFFVDLGKETKYVELLASILVISDNNPLTSIQKSLSRDMKKFSEILGTEVSDYRINLVPKGVSPSGKRWLELNILPRITMTDKAYWVDIIYRDDSVGNVIAFAGDLNSKVAEIIAEIERK